MDHDEDVAALDRLFTGSLAEHGDGAAAVQWSSQETQERRMTVLAEVVPTAVLRTASILDFGCGTGHLLTWLRREHGFTGEYVGYDIAGAMVEQARAQFAGDRSARFEKRDVFVEGVGGTFDLILVNGTFNNLVSDPWSYLTDLLRALFPAAETALAFNLMSSYVEFTNPGLAYHDPEAVFAFCKTELSPLVTLRHDYCVKDGVVPFDFTMYVRPTSLATTARLESAP